MINKTDSYKVSHWLQFPEDMLGSHYYIESRSKYTTLRFFGLQAILKKHFKVTPTRDEVRQWGAFWEAHGLPFNYEGWNYIADLGYYPLKIVAVREGSLVDSGKPIVTVESTDPRVPWLPGWVETLLLQLWYPTTVCTNSYKCKVVIQKFLEDTGTPEQIDFKLHDFGYRGVSSDESASIGGAAHLVNFKGTDTIAGVLEAQRYYNTTAMLGFSIPASEHSTITSWGKGGEVDAYNNMIDKFSREGSVYACVSDSYDLTKAVVNMWGGTLREKVRKSGGTLVVRPDSGDPATVLLRTLRELEYVFGCRLIKGYKVLPDYIRVIQGDGISKPEDINYILAKVTGAGYSADNLAFGMGGGLLQDVNRNTYKFAMKMSAINISGAWRGVYKSPKDARWKRSKRGRQFVEGGVTSFLDGDINEITFEEVRDAV